MLMVETPRLMKFSSIINAQNLQAGYFNFTYCFLAQQEIVLKMISGGTGTRKNELQRVLVLLILPESF